MTVHPDWIAIDWGTSNLRVWAMSADDTPLAEAASDRGMGKLTPSEFEPALLALIAPWLHKPLTAIACGMVGARQGWTEAPYARTPCTPSPTAFTRVGVEVEDEETVGVKLMLSGRFAKVAAALSPKERADFARALENAIWTARRARY